MSRQDIDFKTGDGVTLRGWLYTPSAEAGKSAPEKLPCLVMVHGFTALKEMDLDKFAERFVSKLQLAVLVYDNRGFGASDVAAGQPRREIIPSVQISDFQDAITYAQSRTEVDLEKIGIWGSSYSGGHALYVAAVDRRVKACISQVGFCPLECIEVTGY
jgi:dipeptidyl aminopeptidase/acylaminoacyl peptidase